MTTNYLFHLSPVELQWLSEAFGHTRLPLLDNPLRHTPRSQLEGELKKSVDSLVSRGLVNRSSTNWQVDRIPAAIIQWLGSADDMFILDVHSRNGNPRQAQLFTQEEVSMHVRLNDGRYDFLFLPGRNHLIDHILDEFCVSFVGPKLASGKYEVTQPVPILRAIFTDILLAEKMLKVTGLRSGDIKALLAWGKSLEWFAMLAYIRLEAAETRMKEKLIFCGNQLGCWSGSAGQSSEEAVTLQPTDPNEVRALIEALL